ncbi:MAG: hypothetical protein GY754_12215 [bacterium]|nr:hypothetical protein [bacterium]
MKVKLKLIAVFMLLTTLLFAACNEEVFDDGEIIIPTYIVSYSGNGNNSGSVPTDATEYEDGRLSLLSATREILLEPIIPLWGGIRRQTVMEQTIHRE